MKNPVDYMTIKPTKDNPCSHHRAFNQYFNAVLVNTKDHCSFEENFQCGRENTNVFEKTESKHTETLKRTEGDVKNYLKVKKIDCSPKIKI
jgi:hypothetical protein